MEGIDGQLEFVQVTQTNMCYEFSLSIIGTKSILLCKVSEWDPKTNDKSK